MNQTINLIDSEYSWNSLSLLSFLEEGNIPSSWKEFFEQEEVKEELEKISKYLENESAEIFPPIHQVFRAFYLTPLEKVKAVLIGQDPYHNGSAVGICFSVKPGNNINPSLRNIYKELRLEGFQLNETGDLTHWSKQGILMLNTALTVLRGDPDSHTAIWYDFTTYLIKFIDRKKENDVHWLLFGSKAVNIVAYTAKKGRKHITSHPSPFSANRSTNTVKAFIGSGVFKEIEDIEW